MSEPRTFFDGRVVLHAGDCRRELKSFADNSIDSIVTDPPYFLTSINKRFGANGAAPCQHGKDGSFARLSGGFMQKNWDAPDAPPIDPSFANWFAGFVDGEGCFSVHKKNVNNCETYDCQFSMTLRADDKPTVVDIQRQLGGIGTIADRPAPNDGRNSKPQIRYCISSQKHCQRLRAILQAFPLRAKKARDFEIWSQALDAWLNHEPGQSWEDVAYFRDRLMAVRRFGASYHPEELFHYEWAREAIRVLKPGGYIMAFSSCRTYHRMACAIEDAEFITHPFFAWAFGSGFPKAHSVSKQIDKRGGKSVSWFGPWLRKWRKEKGISSNQIGALFPSKTGGATGCVRNWELGLNLPTNEQFNLICKTFNFPFENMEEAEREVIARGTSGKTAIWNDGGGMGDFDITTSATAAAREWDGWFYGTQSLKPAIEPIYFGQKPFERGLNGAQNVLKWGVGAINVGACRVPSGEPVLSQKGSSGFGGHGYELGNGREYSNSGRWPSNVIHDGGEEVLACFPETVGGGHGEASKTGESWYNGYKYSVAGGLGDSGSAARFFASFPQEDAQRIFYTSKAGADDRLGSKHPTVKPLDLIQYLVRLITPKNGVCLDLFAGTGTTAEAAFREGFRSILIEREDEYIKDIERRMSLVMEGPDTRAYASMKARNRPRDDGPLFGGSEEAPRHPRPTGCIRNGAEGPFGYDGKSEAAE